MALFAFSLREMLLLFILEILREEKRSWRVKDGF